MPRTRLETPAFWLTAILAIALAGAMATLAQGALQGGSDWQQADWLIHNEGGFVRRGMLGSLLIRLGDLLALGPLAATIALQAALAVATALLTWRACLRQGVTAKLLLVVVSAGFFLVFWNGDRQGAFRKEIFVFLSLAILAYGAALPSLPRWQVLASALAFVAGVTAHEGMIFFLPLYLVALNFAWGNLLAPSRRAFAAILLAAVGAVFLFNLVQPRLETIEPVCRSLMDRGFQAAFCEGAIEALTHTLRDEMAVPRAIFQNGGLLNLLYAYGLCLFPFYIYFNDGRDTNWRIIGLLLAIGLPFLPLYAVAMDWGRWASFHMTGAVYLLLILRARGLAPESRRPWPLPLLVATALLPWFCAFNHVAAEPRMGLVPSAVAKVLERVAE